MNCSPFNYDHKNNLVRYRNPNTSTDMYYAYDIGNVRYAKGMVVERAASSSYSCANSTSPVKPGRHGNAMLFTSGTLGTITSGPRTPQTFADLGLNWIEFYHKSDNGTLLLNISIDDNSGIWWETDNIICGFDSSLQYLIQNNWDQNDYENLAVGQHYMIASCYGTISCSFDAGEFLTTQRNTDSFLNNTLLTPGETHFTTYWVAESDGLNCSSASYRGFTDPSANQCCSFSLLPSIALIITGFLDNEGTNADLNIWISIGAALRTTSIAVHEEYERYRARILEYALNLNIEDIKDGKGILIEGAYRYHNAIQLVRCYYEITVTSRGSDAIVKKYTSDGDDASKWQIDRKKSKSYKKSDWYQYDAHPDTELDNYHDKPTGGNLGMGRSKHEDDLYNTYGKGVNGPTVTERYVREFRLFLIPKGMPLLITNADTIMEWSIARTTVIENDSVTRSYEKITHDEQLRACTANDIESLRGGESAGSIPDGNGGKPPYGAKEHFQNKTHGNKYKINERKFKKEE